MRLEQVQYQSGRDRKIIIYKLIKVEQKSLLCYIDTKSSQGRLIFNIFACLAKFERDVISERTQAGLKAARARGLKGERPKGLTEAAKRKTVTATALYAENHYIHLN